ncbi:hypothetical protein MMC06_000834 [Schaereria dolodes]|nr:hypothetical protein [Schaereria dolodes]
MATRPSARGFRLLDLPDEILDRILFAHLARVEPITMVESPQRGFPVSSLRGGPPHPSYQLAIRRVCRRLYFEAGMVFYRCNTFLADDYHHFRSVAQTLYPITRLYVQRIMFTDNCFEGAAEYHIPATRLNFQADIFRMVRSFPRLQIIDFMLTWSMRDQGIMQVMHTIVDQVLTLKHITIRRINTPADLFVPVEEMTMLYEDAQLEARTNTMLGERLSAAQALMELGGERGQ